MIDCIIHDYFQVNGGAERLILALAKNYPASKLFSSSIGIQFKQENYFKKNNVKINILISNFFFGEKNALSL